MYDQYHLFDIVFYLLFDNIPDHGWLKGQLYAIEENVETISVGWGLLIVKLTQRLFDRMKSEKRNNLGDS